MPHASHPGVRLRRRRCPVLDPDARVRRMAEAAFQRSGRATWRRQLRSATLLDQIAHDDVERPGFTFDRAEVARVNALVRMGELTRSARERRRDPGQLPDVAQTYADLAEQHPAGDRNRVELLALAATTWSLAGYQANAATLAEKYLSEIDGSVGTAPLEAPVTAEGAPAAIAVLTGQILRRDVSAVTRLGALADLAARGLSRRFLDEAGDRSLDHADMSVLAVYGLVGRAARGLARLWRVGDRAAGDRAVTDLRVAAELLLNAGVVDTWSLVDNLAYVVEHIVATSPWRLLRRTPNWNGRWERYLRARAVAEHPVVQVWPSQRQALDAGLLDRGTGNMTVTMPTSAGKTQLAEWSILRALAHAADADAPRLAVYVVPTRALAGEVERHLGRSLAPVGIRVSGLFGGAEHVDFESGLVAGSDVLVVTSEKFDLLLRNDVELVDRLALVVVDEGHMLGDPHRGLRLEFVLTRLRRTAPAARVLLLSAVLPNAREVASWLDPTAHRLADVNWSPSPLRIGVFSWQGAEQDGQHGVVQYRADDADHSFFLPYVLTRRRLRTRLFPTEVKDIAADLALHYQRLGPVLIAAPKKASAETAARAVAKAARKAALTLGAGPSGNVPVEVVQERERVVAAIVEYAGQDHDLVRLVRAGVGYHHADVPESVRQALERAYRAGALPILCATSTLAQGVNLPTKTVIISGTRFNQDDELSVRDFRNTAGRAGRPFRETEGHVILVGKTPTEARRLRNRYVDAPKLEPIYSQLFFLYASLVHARMGAFPSGQAVPDHLDFGDPEGDLRTASEELDLQLLAALAEEVVETEDEDVLREAVTALLGDTFAGYELGADDYPLQPLVRYAARRIRAVVARVPDSALRSVFVRTGLTLAGCETALAAARAVNSATATEPSLLAVDRFRDLCGLVLDQAVTVSEVQRSSADEGVTAAALPALVLDWISGATVDELRQRHGGAVGVTDAMKFAKALDRIVVHDLSWVISAVLALAEHDGDAELPAHVTALSAMVKYGVASMPACFAASIGVRSRRDASALAAMFPTDLGTEFDVFTAWVSTLDADDVRGVVDDATAALFLDRAATLVTPREALELALTDEGAITTPIRGIRPLGTAAAVSAMPVGTGLQLRREHGNPADENAITIHAANGQRMGYVAREVARVLAPLFDLEGGPVISSTLAARPPATADAAAFESHDAVTAQITLAPA